MSPVAALILSLSMSADAFAVSVGRGASLNRTGIGEALRTGVVFGIVEAITPLAGWAIGMTATEWVAEYDHWLAFGLLSGVGISMIYGALKPDEEKPGKNLRPSFLILLATAFGTSIDAMAVGMSLSFIDIRLPEILWISIAIGFATFLLSTLGLMIGKAIGKTFGTAAEIGAGVVLCLLGVMILHEHLTA
ncbi:manganese efflux pump MntP [Xanthobacter sp. TB0136]|uniref:manganese efflux pump MntP n=1 Tax=Xanthobacter sp. TB0136 TaxID=3459177 RepID=UPI004039CC47